jgi:hypothetical protein
LIRIDIKIVVDHKSGEEAEKLLKMVTIDFSETSDVIKVVTNIEEGFGTSNFWGNNKKFSIDYKIILPKQINLKISHKYGNIFINEIAGLTEIEHKYGNLNINKLSRGSEKPINTINLGYGNASIDQCAWLKLNVSYSPDVTINLCKALIIVSKYSKVRIEKASSVVAESGYTNYNIGSVANFVITGKYGQFKIDNLTNKLEAEIKYGSINVDNIPPTFESIKLDNSYSNSKLGISPQATYKINAKVNYAGIDYPKSGKVSRIAENTSTTLNGIIGNGTAKSEVTINSSYGGVELFR